MHSNVRGSSYPQLNLILCKKDFSELEGDSSLYRQYHWQALQPWNRSLNSLSQISSEIPFAEGSAYCVGGFILRLYYSAELYPVPIYSTLVSVGSGGGRDESPKRIEGMNPLRECQRWTQESVTRNMVEIARRDSFQLQLSPIEQLLVFCTQTWIK